MVQTLNSGTQGIGHFLANVPKAIEQVIERPPVSELIRLGTKKNMVEACLAAELMKVSNMLTVGGNLREGQALQIAIQLIDDYPNESLEDFCLCLRRGMRGMYGDIFRFDVLVISGWLQKYLEEKYQAIESKLLDEKDDLYKPIKPEAPDPDKHQAWLDKLKEVTKPLDDKKIPPMTTDDVVKEGQDRPKGKFHPTTTESQARAHELHLEYIRRNYDKYTAEKLPHWLPEQEWIQTLSEEDKQSIYKK